MPERGAPAPGCIYSGSTRGPPRKRRRTMTTTPILPLTTAKLLSRHEVAEGTMAFRFERPANWAFKAGQYLDMTLLAPPETDSEGNVRSFSIASGPNEETLMVATRMRDTAFKRVLKTMPLGTAVKIDGPSGDLTLPDSFTRAAVFLAGGIGITPFRSMICLAAAERLPHQIFLFYSNRRPLITSSACGDASLRHSAPATPWPPPIRFVTGHGCRSALRGARWNACW